MATEVPSGTVTFLFTDIEGSTALWEADADAMRTALERHDSIMTAAIGSHLGYVFATGGDGFAAAFPRAGDALAAAAEVQAALASEVWPTTRPLRVRMGIHTGEATERDGDYLGPAVNRAARLMAAGHGGQVLVSEAAASIVGTGGLLDLGRHRLRDLAEPQRLYQLGPAAFPPIRTLDHAPTNLPVQLAGLIGRRDLIAEIAQLIEIEPIVTLTGVGGVGKTRLSLEVGTDLLGRFADGVWLVDLGPVGHDELVLAAAADVLGITPQTGEPLVTTILSSLRERSTLLILDNCEHLVASVARFAERLIRAAPAVRVLATSREALGLPGERVEVVPPLAGETEAVELFLDRSARAGARIEDSAQMAAVREVCIRLDGLPLAIELAAARTRMLTPIQIAERLDQRFRLLTGGGRTAVERHRTLLAAVAWSYDLLDEVERVAFERLSTLAGDFDLEAAEAIVGGDPVDGTEVLDLLGNLVDKSMIVLVGGGEKARYRLLESLRQFGADRLAERTDAEDVRARYGNYWLARARTLGRSVGGQDQSTVLDAIDIDIDNYRAAFAQILGDGAIEDAARAILALSGYWQIRRSREGLRWHRQLLEYPILSPERRRRILAHIGHAEATLGDTFAAERFALEAVSSADAGGVEPPWNALQALMMVSQERHDAESHHRWYERALRLADRSEQRYLYMLTATQRYTTGRTEDLREVLAHYERLLEEVCQLGDPLLVPLAANMFAYALYDDGQIERACQTAQFAVDSAHEAGPLARGGATGAAAAIYTLSGRILAARHAITEVLDIARSEGCTLQLIHVAYDASLLTARAGEVSAAAALLAATIRLADPLGIVGDYLHYTCRVEAQRAIEAWKGGAEDGVTPVAMLSLGELHALVTTTLETVNVDDPAALNQISRSR